MSATRCEHVGDLTTCFAGQEKGIIVYGPKQTQYEIFQKRLVTQLCLCPRCPNRNESITLQEQRPLCVRGTTLCPVTYSGFKLRCETSVRSGHQRYVLELCQLFY